MTTTPTVFPAFPRLPPEIRRLIWYHTLPTKLGPTLYYNDSRLWQPRSYKPAGSLDGSESDGSESDGSESEGSEPDGSESGTDEDLEVDIRGEIRCDIPPAFVNYEAHSLALAWSQKNSSSSGRYRLQRLATGAIVFNRPLDIDRDAVFVATSRDMRELFSDQEMRKFRHGVEASSATTYMPGPRLIAVPEKSIQTQPDAVALMIVGNAPVILLAVKDAPHSVGSVQNSSHLVTSIEPLPMSSQRWEFEECPGSLIWNQDCRDFPRGDCLGLEQEQCIARLGEQIRYFQRLTDWEGDFCLEIRTAVAVRGEGICVTDCNQVTWWPANSSTAS